MINFFQQWLDGRYSLPGMIACAVVTTDSAGFCRSTDANFPAVKMGEIIRLLQDSTSLPGVQSSAVRWHTWVFANGKIRFVTRPDGWTFAFAVRANSDAAQILDPLTDEFLALKPGG